MQADAHRVSVGEQSIVHINVKTGVPTGRCAPGDRQCVGKNDAGREKREKKREGEDCTLADVSGSPFSLCSLLFSYLFSLFSLASLLQAPPVFHLPYHCAQVLEQLLSCRLRGVPDKLPANLFWRERRDRREQVEATSKITGRELICPP